MVHFQYRTFAHINSNCAWFRGWCNSSTSLLANAMLASCCCCCCCCYCFIIIYFAAELGTLFPSIPLVAEEDSTFLRANNLAHSVLTVVTEKSSSQNELTQDDVLEAIDRGANVGFAFGSKPATYWVGIPNLECCVCFSFFNFLIFECRHCQWNSICYIWSLLMWF